MEKSFSKRSVINAFWLSVLLHLLLLLAFTTVIVLYPEEENKKSPQYYVPAYTYQPKSGSMQQQVAHTAKSIPQRAEMPRTQVAEKAPQAFSTAKKPIRHQSMMAASLASLQQQQVNSIKASRNEDPIYLIGDENEVADPLIKLLAKSLSAHFNYPRLAGELGIRGRVLIGLTLHPGGYFSDVEMVSSSHNNDLDAAALYAVNTAPTVNGADRFITQPKHFVIGFVFR